MGNLRVTNLQQQEELVLQELKNLVESYQLSRNGSWLTEIDWKNVPVKMVDFQDWSLSWLTKDVCGMQFFGTIYLMRSLVSQSVFPTYVHELHHVWQSRKKPGQYLIGKLIRPLIEQDARAEEQKAEDWLEMINHINCPLCQM